MVALTKTGQYIVTPDNGTLSYIKKDVGIVAVREISEVENRCSNTELSYTFHGRDVYAYTGAKLASGHISFEEMCIRDRLVSMSSHHSHSHGRAGWP